MEIVERLGFMKENIINSNMCCCVVKKDENWRLFNDFSSLEVISDFSENDFGEMVKKGNKIGIYLVLLLEKNWLLEEGER